VFNVWSQKKKASIHEEGIVARGRVLRELRAEMYLRVMSLLLPRG
jgi:hypothetical protein